MNSIELNIQRDPFNDKILETYKSEFNKTVSFYKKYNIDIYNRLLNLKDNPNELKNIYESKEYLLSKNILIPYLKKINFTNLDSVISYTKLEKIICETEIENFIEPKLENMENLAIALNIEKYYQECKLFFKDCPDYPDDFQLPIFDPCRYPNILTLYNHFNEYCHDQRQMHSLAGDYYSNLNKYILIPSIIFASLGSIFSFLSSMCFFSEFERDLLSIFVGVTSCVVALMQSFTAAYQFDTKSSHHYKSADFYDQLLTSIDFEKSYPSNKNFFKDLEKEVIKIKSNCPYLVPIFLKKKYYKKKDKQDFENFIRKSIINPGRKELIDSLYSNNKKSVINDNLDYITNKIIEMKNLENNFIDNYNLNKNHHQSNIPQPPCPTLYN